MDAPAQAAPAPQRRGKAETLGAAYHPIHRDPCHNLRVGEVLWLTAHLPDSVIGLVPDLLETSHERELQLPACLVDSQLALAPMMEDVHDLAVDVELQLPACRVADAHRSGMLIARQPRQLPLRQQALTRDSVQDLHPLRVAGHGALQPRAPQLCLLIEAAVHHRLQREGGITQPAVTIVPVAHTADPLRQRGGDRSDDSTSRTVAQRLERDERAPYCVGVFPGRRRPPDPAPPEARGCIQGTGRVDDRGQGCIRGGVAQDETDRLTGTDLELSDSLEILAP